jgi:hypothetical protein
LKDALKKGELFDCDVPISSAVENRIWYFFSGSIP